MSSAEERIATQARNIAQHLGNLVKIMTTVNENIVEFAKQIKESDETYDQNMREKGDMMALIPRNYVPVEGYCAGQPTSKTQTPLEWMRELHRWWNYSDEHKTIAEYCWTKDEFFAVMAEHGNEITDTIPKEMR